MTVTPWDGFGYGPWEGTTVVPQLPPDEETRAAGDLPRTLLPVAGDGVVQHPAFDPALKHYAKAMRLSEPRFADTAAGHAWTAARRRAMDHVLAAIAASPWAGHLVLRGSVLLAAWFGDAAREPGDLDFVVVPDTWDLRDDRTDALLDDIARAAEDLSRQDGPVLIDAAGAASDEIWTYERVPGRRLVLPWTVPGEDLPSGTVQLDFVFNERLPQPGIPTALPRPQGGEPLRLLAATPELSLAWKLLWLASDTYPEGKDLYDAVLLAEHADLPYDLLHQVFVAADEWYAGFDLPLGHILGEAAGADWPEFRKDHPHVPGTCMDWLLRLARALAPVFAPDGNTTYERLATAYAYLTDQLREPYEQGGLAAVEEWLGQRTVITLEALVSVRELLGRDTHDLDATAALLAGFRRRPRWGQEEGEPVFQPWYGDPQAIATWLRAADETG
ncbi:hypothetical protein GCM10010218_49450 [Streptomyces mashuensis]|uniref:Nucleotidyltransferase AbiEii toxin of type IV toxin-antitoxin system n=1 Tax=Streptomyces mashuensis TaxID=33904 RepID=A0A919B636_9ACTN|nr:nucleotidyl transferase AbiEii/AbiGii toxin family protein [Streptomyces mashuensis]GHF61931.1 hypothetical protein GCM10010218_49450 [Streptomyces mashuensis]